MTGRRSRALQQLAARGVPVCICTSKTVAEIRVLRRAMGNDAPFAVENGGVVAVPRGYFDEEKTVEVFVESIINAGEKYLANPMEVPFMPTLKRVRAAFPEFLADYHAAVEADRADAISSAS